MADTYFIVRDKTLDLFHCSKCQNYLSVGPIIVEGSRFICGRCNQGNTECKIMLPEDDMRRKLFRCIHRYNGCRVLLRYEEVASHEETCPKAISSFLCVRCSYSGNGCQLYYHYMQNHSQMIREKSLFTFIPFKPSKPIYYLTRKDDYLFLVKAALLGNDLCIQIVNYGEKAASNSAEYDITFTAVSVTNSHYKVPSRPCVSKPNIPELEKDAKSVSVFNMEKVSAALDIPNDTPLLCEINFSIMQIDPQCVHLSKANQVIETVTVNTDNATQVNQLVSSGAEDVDMSKEIEELKNRNQQLTQLVDDLSEKIWPILFKCSNCNAFLSNVLRWCKNHHIRCEECFGEYCNVCKDDTTYKFIADGRNSILNLIGLPCRWNCLGVFERSKLRLHEFKCVDRKYSCPQPFCRWQGTLDEVFNHWHSDIPLLKGTCQVSSFDKDEKVFYIADCKDFFLVKFLALSDMGRDVEVKKISRLSHNITDLYPVIHIAVMYNAPKVMFIKQSYRLHFGIPCSISLPSKLYYEVSVGIVNEKPVDLNYYGAEEFS